MNKAYRAKLSRFYKKDVRLGFGTMTLGESGFTVKQDYPENISIEIPYSEVTSYKSVFANVYLELNRADELNFIEIDSNFGSWPLLKRLKSLGVPPQDTNVSPRDALKIVKFMFFAFALSAIVLLSINFSVRFLSGITHISAGAMVYIVVIPLFTLGWSFIYRKRS
jgi:hypothetical protein